MKGVLLRQLQATGVAPPGLVNRLLSSATGADCKPASIFNDGAVRGLATGADIMCGPSRKKEKSPEREDQPPTTESASPEEPAEAALPAPHSSEQKWWRPDPVTGTWVPEGSQGQVTTSTPAMKSPPRTTRTCSEPTASLEAKRWWTSMEELPDMDRANPK